jgi:PhoH-like ATPase
MFVIAAGKSDILRVIAKVNATCTCLEVVCTIDNVYGVSPKNLEQLMAMHLLLDPEIPLVTFIGKAGTGKTLISTAAGLMQVEDKESLYDKLTLTKPICDMGKDIGALPGDEEAKLAPYLESYMDALEFIFGGEDEMNNVLGYMKDNNTFKMAGLNFIRGRSLPGQFFIVDEVQNQTKHEGKSTVTRMGLNSKIVLMGDPNQIDRKGLDPLNNALVHIMDKFKNEPLAGHITLSEGVRSPLADRAADIL